MNKSFLVNQEQKNVETLKKMAKAIDDGNIQEWLTYMTDDVEIRVLVPKEIPIGGTFRGHKGMQQFLEENRKIWSKEWQTREAIVQGNKIVVIGREQARILPHNKIYEADYATILFFCHGKVSKMQLFLDGVTLLKAYRGK